ncbi:hypothetical protein [Herbiconiux liukaitaii]|uniref:hypothetical protein n=1 Tax=Herbiconiux liukaitaii TaxID=3342799 RepID=UPI0035B9004A
MIALAAGALVCLAVGRERSLWAGWLPAVTMLTAMLALAAGSLVPGWAVLLLAVALLVAGVLAARGHDRLMSIHRGISAIAMAALSITAVAVPTPSSTGASATAVAGTSAATGHHSITFGPGVALLGLAVAVGAIGVVFAVRSVREHRATTAGPTAALAGGGAVALTRIRVARLAEVLLMTAGVAVMLLHT